MLSRPSSAMTMAAAIVVVVLALTPGASASLLGDTITTDAVWQNAPGGARTLLSGATAVVDAVAVEYSVPIPGLGGSEFAIDFFADGTFTVVFDPADFTVWPIDIDISITDLDFSPAAVLTNVQQTSSNAAGFLDVIGFTDDTITLGSSAASAGGATFTATFAYTTDSVGGNTPVGTSVVVVPEDQTTATTPVTLTFDEITVAGETTLATTTSGPAPPPGYALCTPQTWYELWTTATMAPASSVEVCVDLAALGCATGPASLHAWRDTDANGIPDTWVEVTTSSSAAQVCGVTDELGIFAVFVPAEEEACVVVRRSLTGEEPNRLAVEFATGCGPGSRITAVEVNVGSGHTIEPTTGIVCVPNSHTWIGAGNSYVRIDFDPPLEPGQTYTECIADDLGGYWDSGQTVKVFVDCFDGPVVLAARFDDFYDVFTNKTIRISEATPGCETWTPTWGFTFDQGSHEGWTMAGAFSETGGGPYASNFSFLWEDRTDYPAAILGDPVDGEVGAIGFTTPGGHGVPSTGNSYWIMQLHSPDLTGNLQWQSATGYSVRIGEDMAASSTIYANLYVVAHDLDQGTDRFFFNGAATPLALGGWSTFSFDWSAIGTFPTNYIIREVFVNVWGTMSGSYAGGVYLDDVVPEPLPTSVGPPPTRDPLAVRLYRPVPNPFNPATRLRFEVPRPARVDLRIYSLAGRLVRTLLADEPFTAGVHDERWDGRDDAGRTAASGVYVARMQVGAEVRSQRMVLLK